jgi:hypothetical protein
MAKNGPKAKKAPFLRSTEAPGTAVDDLPPAFSFEKMQDGSGHSFNCCVDDDRLALAKRFFMLSREPWRKIAMAPSKGFGAEQIPKYRIKPPIPSSVTEGVSWFYSLHYSGKKRFLGYKVGQVFYVLWLDHDFKIYTHGS